MRRRLAQVLVHHLSAVSRGAPASSSSGMAAALSPCAPPPSARPLTIASASSNGRPRHAPPPSSRRRGPVPNPQHRRGAASPAPREDDDSSLGDRPPHPPPAPGARRGRPPGSQAGGLEGRLPPALATSPRSPSSPRRSTDAGRAMPRGVWGVLTKLRDEGYASFLVGGAVRDTLAGRPPKDFDILTTAPPSALLKFFRKARLIGARFPVVHVLGSGRDVHEVSTLLPGGAEGGVAELPPPPRGGGPGAPPPPPKTARAARQRAALAALDGGVWPADAAERGAAIAAALAASAAARDFTVNALFFDPWTGEVHDPTGRGLADLAARRLASVDEPGASFASDPARMLRAVRLVSRTGLRLAPADADAIGTHAHLTASLSAGRLGGELTAWLAHGHAAPAVAVARRCGLLPYVLPAHAALLDAECGPMGRGEGALAGEGEGDAQPSRRAPARVGGMAALPALDSCASPSSPAPPAIVAAALLMPLLADEIRRWAPGASADEAGPAPSSGSGSEGDDPGSSHDADRPPETPAESAFRRLVHRAIGRMCVPVACAEAAADPNTRLISRATAASAGRMIRAAAAGELSGSGADARPPRATSSGLARYEPVFRECLPLAAAVRAKVVGRES